MKALLIGCLAAATCLPTAQAFQRPDRRNAAQTESLAVPDQSGIAWFGRWEDARAEAQRTGRPILLMSAAPRCSGVPGMW